MLTTSTLLRWGDLDETRRRRGRLRELLLILAGAGVAALVATQELAGASKTALIAIVGEGMSHAIGIAAKVFGALAEARVNVRLINQGPSELNIIVGVAPEDYPTALRAIYAAFVTGAQ